MKKVVSSAKKKHDNDKVFHKEAVRRGYKKKKGFLSNKVSFITNIAKLSLLVSGLLIIGLSIDYYSYASTTDVVALNTPKTAVRTKAQFRADRDLGKVDMDNINDVMYGSLDISKLNIDKSLVPSEEAYRLNMEVLELVAEATDLEKYKTTYPNKENNIALSTFYETFDPLMMISKTRTEWNGKENPEYAISPFIPGDKLKSNGVSPAEVSAKDIGKNFPQGVSGYDAGVNYLGPLQIEYTYLSGSTLKIPNQYEKPSDEYAILDSTLYVALKYAHNLSSPNESFKYYTIQSPYELVAVLGLSHNTGPSFYSTDNDWNINCCIVGYPWRNTGKLRQYASDLCRQENLAKILDKAEKDFLEFKNNPESRNYNLPNMDRHAAVELFNSTGLDVSEYLCDARASEFRAGRSATRTDGQEKIAFPIQQIYNYHMLRLFYTSGGEAQ